MARTRGKNKAPTLVHVSLRLPEYVVEFYKDKDQNYTKAMRAMLEEHTPKIQTPNEEQIEMKFHKAD